MRIKVRLFLGIFFCGFFNALAAQNDALANADSLFNEQKYTEAYEKYDSLFQNNQASNAMLLKMAFIQDGLGNYSEALFYLDTYFQASADRSVIAKIEELAEANNLEGYGYDDTDYFQALVKKYKLYFILLLSAIMLLMLSYVFRKTNQKERPMAAGVIQFIVVFLLFAIINFQASPEAILISNETLLRSGPSAGAEPIEKLQKGHKVKVLDKDEVWTQILWDGREVYVRNGKLRII